MNNIINYLYILVLLVSSSIYAEEVEEPQQPIPLADIIAAVEMILSLSPQVELGDINLMQRNN